MSREDCFHYTVVYATGADGQKFSAEPSDWLTAVPTVTNADTLGVRPDLVSPPPPPVGPI